MHIYDIIEKKRDGGELSYEELRYAVMGFTDGSIHDYKMSALVMAMFLRGMTPRETADLTDIMAKSGETVDLSRFGELSVDKHSTGGVGDKTTLILAPTVAALGGKIAKMSGRALGHTGGTVDKLESFRGFNTTLPIGDFLSQVERIGVAVIGQSTELTPADKKLYALRDQTATVNSIPLIASSIMSKKLATGSRAIVLDVKYGSGAFMNTLADARLLAEAMVDIGIKNGRRVTAVISNMNVPLGNAIGNALEIREAIAVLRGEGPDDITEVAQTLAAEMLALCRGWSPADAREQVKVAVGGGMAYEKFREWITYQGGDPGYFDGTVSLPDASRKYPVLAKCSGYVSSVNTAELGKIAHILGSGREDTEGEIDMSAGLTVKCKPGDFVNEGDMLACLHTNSEAVLEEAEERTLDTYTFSNTKSNAEPPIADIIRGE